MKQLRKYSTTLCFLIAGLIFASTVLADQDRWVETGHEADPTDRANRIIKWCSNEGNHVRFASANLQIKGYHSCGKLAAISSCSPGGKRFITKSDKMPHGYLDCSRGPRIYIKRHDDGIIYSSDGTEPLEDITPPENMAQEATVTPVISIKDPMSTAERKALRREFEKIAQNNGSNINISQAFLPLIKAFQRSNKGNRRPRFGSNPTKIDIKNVLKSLDPQTKDLLKDVLGPNYESQLRKLFHEQYKYAP